LSDRITPSTTAESSASPNGSAWAALLSAGIGAFAFGVMTILSEVFTKWASRTLQWYRPSGALSGVAGCAVIVWLVVWVVLHTRWNGKQLQRHYALMITTLLLAVAALIATFPSFYELLGG
jgi:hypothetical protein